jgi:AcrR family transcriptional regulator
VTRRADGYHHGDLRRALVDAAIVLLERGGPERLSLREVARAAGVSQSAPYNHFAGKQDLLAWLATTGFRELEASQAAIAAADGPADGRLVDLGVDYLRAALARPQLYRLMFGTGIEDWSAHPALVGAKGASADPLKAAIARYLSGSAQPDGEVVDTAMVVLWSLVHGLASLSIDGSLNRDKHPDLEEFVRRGVAVFVGGLDRVGDGARGTAL